VCATIFVREGEREREQKKKKRKLENLKIKRNSICRRLRIAKERKKIASCRQTRSISMFLNVTSFSYEKNRSQSSIDIELIRRATPRRRSPRRRYRFSSFSIFASWTLRKNVIFFRPLSLWKHVLMSEKITFFSRLYDTKSDEFLTNG
jgi:hypothetical protein